MIEQAQAIALILESELGSRVTLYDALSGVELPLYTRDARSYLRNDLTAELVQALAQSKKPQIQALTENTYRAILPIKDNGTTRLLGIASLNRFATTDMATKEETARLERWSSLLLEKITTISERGKGQQEARQRENQACAVLAAYDILLRNTRIHGDTGRFQRHALKAIAEILCAESAVCVIDQQSTTHSIVGVTGFSNWECRQLAAHLAARGDWDRAGVLIDNETSSSPLGKIFPQIRCLVAVRIPAESRHGYVVAINKTGRAKDLESESPGKPRAGATDNRSKVSFQRSDAALLASFSSLVGAQARTSYRHQDLKDLVVGLTRALTAAIDAKDSYTAGHSERVARMSVELGKEMGLPEEQLNDIYLAGLLHDIGKIGIRDDVLRKDAPLTDEERKHINEHVRIGHRILSGLTGIDHLLGGVLYHHEKYDGTGYPEGLAGERIPRLARIIAVADSFDAMSSDRPYRKGMHPEKVEAILREGSGIQWDPVLIDAFLRCKDRLREIRQRGIGDSLLQALSGAMGQEYAKDDVSLNFSL